MANAIKACFVNNHSPIIMIQSFFMENLASDLKKNPNPGHEYRRHPSENLHRNRAN